MLLFAIVRPEVRKEILHGEARFEQSQIFQFDVFHIGFCRSAAIMRLS